MATDGAQFTNQFLIAMPGMADPNFTGAVVFVCEHKEEGALGLVINRPTDLKLATLFERIELQLEIAPWKDLPVYYGGPVTPDRGFVLHAPLGQYGSTLAISDQLGLTTSKDVLQAVAEGAGPKQFFVTLGYAGWGPGQLESEVAQNAWLSVAADASVIFDTPSEDRFEAAIRLLGIDPIMLTGSAGHA
jgi:putative transcriptional regulator